MAGLSVDINILCRLFQHQCHQRAVFQGLNRYRGAESVVLLFSNSTVPGGVYPNVPNGAVSIANCLILWDFEIHEFHSKRAIFSIR
jgi:hypothetical protein